MTGDLHGNRCADDGFVRRVARALDRTRIGVVALVTLLLSAEALTGSEGLQFFSAADLVVLWAEHSAELLVIAAVLTLAFTVLEQALRRQHAPLRLAATCGLLWALSVAATYLLYAYYAHGFDFAPPAQRFLADSLRFALPAVFLVIIADVHRHALRVDAAARPAEFTRARLRHDEADQQLALLQAQIEPHFLFNVLANVRRLYRTQPHAGAETIQSLMRYLHGALPRLRTRHASLGDELALVRAYLDLLKVRMGPRLAFAVAADPALADSEFPPTLLITLVENAIKHGLEPVGGGQVRVTVHSDAGTLHVDVVDDGAGLGAAASDGKGVGLVNVRRQLLARYQGRAKLTLASASPHGTRATISIPRGIAPAVPHAA